MKNKVLYPTIAVFALLLGLLRYVMNLWNIPLTIGIIIMLFGVYLFMFLKFEEVSKSQLYLLFGFALLLRLMFFTSDPKVLSDDVYRYIWDGKVQAQGINPYLHPPSSDVLDFLRGGEIYPHINHKDYKTIYPPVAQIIFFTSYITGRGSLISLRIIFLLLEVLALYYLFRITGTRKSILLYLFCPIVIIETYVALHIDLAGMAFLIPAIYYLQKKKWLPSLFFLILAIEIKYIALVTAPIFFLSILNEKRKNVSLVKSLGAVIPYGIFFLAVSILLYIPYLGAGAALFDQLLIYNLNWEFNSSVFVLIRFFAEGYARYIVFLLFAAAAFYIYFKRHVNDIDKVELVLLAMLLLTHTLYPWYLLWLVPFLILRYKRSEFFLIAVISLSYWVLIDYHGSRIWHQSGAVRLIQYLPFYGLLLYDLIKGNYVQRKNNSGYNTGTE